MNVCISVCLCVRCELDSLTNVVAVSIIVIIIIVIILIIIIVVVAVDSNVSICRRVGQMVLGCSMIDAASRVRRSQLNVVRKQEHTRLLQCCWGACSRRPQVRVNVNV